MTEPPFLTWRISRRLLFLSLFFLFFLGTGCGRRKLETEYATSRGDSINGISTFLQYLRGSGHRVESVPYLSPRVGARANFLVVFHDSQKPIGPEAQKGILELIYTSRIGAILFVLNNGDMTAEYFQALLRGGSLDPDQRIRIRESLDLLERQKTASNGDKGLEFPPEETGGFYGMKNIDRTKDSGPIRVEMFSPPEPEGDMSTIAPDASSENQNAPDAVRPVGKLIKMFPPAEWRLQRRLIPGKDPFVRWCSGEDPLLTYKTIFRTRFLVLASAIPLLNAGLADPGNRILCEDLVGLFPPNSRVIVSNSSDWMPKADDGPDGGILRFLRVQPFPWIFGQALLAIIFFCWWKFPIFGRARSENGDTVKRFGRHIDALGDLLRRTRDRSFVLKRIREWQRVRNRTK